MDALTLIADLITTAILSVIGFYLFVKIRYVEKASCVQSDFVLFLGLYLMVGSWTRVTSWFEAGLGWTGVDQVVSVISALLACAVGYTFWRIRNQHMSIAEALRKFPGVRGA